MMTRMLQLKLDYQYHLVEAELVGLQPQQHVHTCICICICIVLDKISHHNFASTSSDSED